ncbi:MAG: LD-carboxypeptidase, partial [Muribaculum sp.]|nr:LD-carboxypeptidase [Muribaculum sp.]
LNAGDRIAILSPAGIINPDYVEGAIKTLRTQGWDAYATKHALGRNGTYSGTPVERLADFNEALDDPTTRAILCSRGGYGAIHLLRDFPIDKFKSDPRWLIGFSDISALHALLSTNGIASIHASMAKHLTLFSEDDPDSTALFRILRGNLPEYTLSSDYRSICGNASGRLVGGNLAVLQALINTPYDIISLPDTILFIEDIAEPIYKVERILYQLRLSGVLHKLSGLIIGQFTEYSPDRNHTDMYDALLPLVSDLGIPVAVNFPVGHVNHNLPLIESAYCHLTITTDTTKLSFGNRQ